MRVCMISQKLLGSLCDLSIKNKLYKSAGYSDSRRDSVPNVKTVQVCKRACSLSHWQKTSPQALSIVITGGYAQNIERKRGIKTRTLTNKLLQGIAQ